MSKPLKVALVVEGQTDLVVIEAAISRVLGSRSYVPIWLNSDAEQSLAFGPVDTGWKGVFRWCRESAALGGGSLRNDPRLFSFHDVLVLHVDADVADKTYRSANIKEHIGDLPCAEPCPPPRSTTDRLRRVLLGWAGEVTTPGQNGPVHSFEEHGDLGYCGTVSERSCIVSR